MTESAKIIKIVVGVSAGVIILLAILLSSSYSDVEYYEVSVHLSIEKYIS